MDDISASNESQLNRFGLQLIKEINSTMREIRISFKILLPRSGSCIFQQVRRCALRCVVRKKKSKRYIRGLSQHRIFGKITPRPSSKLTRFISHRDASRRSRMPVLHLILSLFPLAPHSKAITRINSAIFHFSDLLASQVRQTQCHRGTKSSY